MFGRLRRGYQRLANCCRTFPSWADYRTFCYCETAPATATPVSLRVRRVLHPLQCRPGTSDPAVLLDTFGEGYHRPTMPLPPTATIVDLGANVGYTAVDFALHYPTARVIAVEMDADNCRLARDNLQPFAARVQLTEAAIWVQDGEITYQGDTAWGLRVDGSTAGRRARALRMETLLLHSGVAWVDFVKMDIEGAEAQVIGADASWLDRVGAIQVECHPPATYTSIAAQLRSFGFHCVFDRRAIIGTRCSGVAPVAVA
jgi:FkbM family methyltransferase